MVIGNGLIARSFEQYTSSEEWVIFASGVSNSKTSVPADFEREAQLLAGTIAGNVAKKIVYFSTSSVNDPDLQDTEYVQHKLRMEGLIQGKAQQYNIFRLSNLAGFSNNPHTVLNFFYQHIIEQLPFELWVNSERNIIDVADVFITVDHVLQNGLFPNQCINIANTENYPVKYIVQTIERFCKKKAIYEEKRKGSTFTIDLAAILPVYRALNVRFDHDYLPALLEKYYSWHDLQKSGS